MATAQFSRTAEEPVRPCEKLAAVAGISTLPSVEQLLDVPVRQEQTRGQVVYDTAKPHRKACRADTSSGDTSAAV